MDERMGGFNGLEDLCWKSDMKDVVAEEFRTNRLNV